ncbi:uncharacterized protein [Macrobrachium rosenbergii]|uniref:uncharacterized protein n=1 Tax=Macrobrachium rosenbergii TaxID=79674 RepID=UPI0034D625B7
MDNASYHSKFMNKAPTDSSKTSQIIQWLTENKIPHDPSLMKVELLCLVKLNKHNQVFCTDEMALEKGHEVLRLPPYHSHLNPIELIWSQLKSSIRSQNSNANQTLPRIDAVARGETEAINADYWKKTYSSHQKDRRGIYKKDIVVDHLIESFAIDISEDTSDSEYSKDD